MSARGRIVGWSLLLVALALVASVAISGQVLLARVDNRLSIEIAHEGDKLRAHAANAVDPGTGAPFAAVDRLLTAYLRDNVPEQDETFFSVVAGRADHRSPQPPLARLDTDAAVIGMAASAREPLMRMVTTDAGEALVGVFPVRMASDPRPAALVVVEFVAPLRAEAWSVIRLLAAIGFGALSLAGFAAWLVAGRVLRPMRQVRQTAERIGENDLSARIAVTGTDDVALLAKTFNRMLDRLERSFAAQRDFMDDAGHELRTPLTIIRGHLELMGDDPDERAEVMPLLLDEIDRMRRLVDDLTILAQAGRPDFLHPELVDIADVVVDLIAKTAALAPRNWQIDAVADGHIVADGQRLTQALMQLCSNAVAHTQPGDVIAAGSLIAAGRLRLWVRDTGSGIAPDDRRQLFERAFRGRNSRGKAGSGLGLAIVAAIAEASGGFVTVASRPGDGSTFTIDLPVTSTPRNTASEVSTPTGGGSERWPAS